MPLYLLQAAPSSSAADVWQTPIMLMAIFAIFYFVVIRPQSRERKKLEAAREQLKKGDRVMTQGGIVARVREVKNAEIVLDLDGTARMTVVKAAIQTVISDDAPAASEAKAAKAG